MRSDSRGCEPDDALLSDGLQRPGAVTPSPPDRQLYTALLQLNGAAVALGEAMGLDYAELRDFLRSAFFRHLAALTAVEPRDWMELVAWELDIYRAAAEEEEAP